MFTTMPWNYYVGIICLILAIALFIFSIYRLPRENYKGSCQDGPHTIGQLCLMESFAFGIVGLLFGINGW